MRYLGSTAVDDRDDRRPLLILICGVLHFFQEVGIEAWIEQIVETWRMNNRVSLYLLDAVPPEALTSVLPSGRARTVA